MKRGVVLLAFPPLFVASSAQNYPFAPYGEWEVEEDYLCTDKLKRVGKGSRLHGECEQRNDRAYMGLLHERRPREEVTVCVRL